VKKKVLKIIEDDDESDKKNNQDPLSKKNSINKKYKENNNSACIEYTRKNIDKAFNENNIKVSKFLNADNATSEGKYRNLYPNKINEMNDSHVNSVHPTSSYYSQNNNFNKIGLNYGGEKITNVIIPKKVLSDYPITYEEVKAKMKAYYNRKLIQRQRIHSGNYENKPNESVHREATSLSKNDQVNNYRKKSEVYEEKIKKKLGSNNSKNSVNEQFDNSNNMFNNPGLKKANEHFSFNPNNIIINSNNNYNNINLNIINKDRNNEADKNMIPKSN